jgi:hypothetical protein
MVRIWILASNFPNNSTTTIIEISIQSINTRRIFYIPHHHVPGQNFGQ